MYELLYERQAEWAALSAEDDVIIPKLVEYAAELGLDTERFQQDLTNHIYQDEIIADYEAYSEYGRLATPTFAVNNVFVSANEIEAVINLIFLQDHMYDTVPSQVIDTNKGHTATIRTTRGDIVIELYTKRAPVNINSFAFLAQEGWYDGTTFYVVIPGTATQAGDPTNTGAGYPGYNCSAEIIPEFTFDTGGLVGLAPSGQFIITFDALSQLDGEITIIGKVVEGIDVAQNLTPRDPSQGMALPPGDAIETIIIEEK
jgi:cyclophilin family peptidyl-prolyl cis-trans isomerase